VGCRWCQFFVSQLVSRVPPGSFFNLVLLGLKGQLIIYAVPLEKFRGKGMKFSKTWKQVSLCSCPLVLVNTLVASYGMDVQISTRFLKGVHANNSPPS